MAKIDTLVQDFLAHKKIAVVGVPDKRETALRLGFVLLSIYLFSRLPFAWWVLPLFFFAPDVSLVGLLAEKRTSALTYATCFIIKRLLWERMLWATCWASRYYLWWGLLLGHSSFDRVLGLGLMDATGKPQPTIPPTTLKCASFNLFT